MTTSLQWQNGGLLAGALLSSLAVCIGAAVLGGLLWAWRNRRNLGAPSLDDLSARRPEPRLEPRSVFSEPKCRWLAVRNGDLARVQSALGLARAFRCSWTEGVSAAVEQRLFVSPPVWGWTLVVGGRLPDPSEDIDACFHFLRRLSRQLGQVQFFSVDRALNHHAWARLDDGRVARAYAWAGATLWNQGPLTQAELDLGLECLDYAAEPDFAAAEAAAANTFKVPALATRWSLNPAAVDERNLASSLGVAGDLQPFKTH